MSEYQYYEFVAVDRPLNDRQLDELRALSTRAEITSTSFVNEYHWGDFRGDPHALMERYFDAFLYLANWGTHWLMIRLPARLLDLDTAQRYCVGETASARRAAGRVIIDLRSEDESGEWVETGGGRLSSIVAVRAELAAGDLRALYLAWLLCVQNEELDNDELEPPVPPGLRTLSAPQASLAEFLRIDEDLLAVAAGTSAPLAPDDSQADLERWVESLPEQEKNALLLRVVRGDGGQLRAELLRRFRGPVVTGAGHRTAGDLLDTADARRTGRERAAAEQAAAERARREREEMLKREQRLESLARREEHAWQRISAMIDTKKPAEYDNAVALLEDLQAVSERKDSVQDFERRVLELREAHRRKPSLINRLDSAGLLRPHRG